MAKWIKLGTKVVNVDMILELRGTSNGRIVVCLYDGSTLNDADELKVLELLKADGVEMPDPIPPTTGPVVELANRPRR